MINIKFELRKLSRNEKVNTLAVKDFVVNEQKN